MSQNPYTPPKTVASNPSEWFEEPDPIGPYLAGRFTRFSAALVDGLLILAILLPIQFLTGFIERAQSQQVGVLEQLAMSLAGLIVMLVLNGYLLANRGQTIGKYLTKIQIVDYPSGKLVPFVRLFVFRYLWTLPVVLITAFIPGTTDDLLLNFLIFVDALMIFNAKRRCLHDFLARTSVVQYRDGRPKLIVETAK